MSRDISQAELDRLRPIAFERGLNYRTHYKAIIARRADYVCPGPGCALCQPPLTTMTVSGRKVKP